MKSKQGSIKLDELSKNITVEQKEVLLNITKDCRVFFYLIQSDYTEKHFAEKYHDTD